MLHLASDAGGIGEITMYQEVQFERWEPAQKEGNRKMQPLHQSEGK